ncbi:MAG TPA: type II CAAX endopeptidase family protein [Symbiobacteriaceae bacterium]|jgi:membrane protease YdiL (CAAX protease family)|nr:type II CAAX endopeptidase family protein [Symbiobacteriaceae bacterium]
MSNWVKRYQIPLFFVLAYAIAWAIWIPTVLKARGVIGWEIPGAGTFGLFGSSIAATLTAWLAEGRPAVRTIWARIFRLRVGLVWYVTAFALPMLLGVATMGLGALAGHGPYFGVEMPLKMAPLYFLSEILTMVLTEEPGWRGYALPKLQERFSPLVSSLVLGVLWGLWHIPLFLIPGRPQTAMPFIGFVLAALMGSVLMAWVQNNGGSSFLPVIFHASMNTMFALFGVLTHGAPLFWTSVAVWAVAAAGVAVYSPEKKSWRRVDFAQARSSLK